MRLRHPGRPSILLVAVTAVVLSGAAPASAEVTIAVSPALLELDGRAGGRGVVEITISNSGDEPFEVVTSLAPLQDLTDERSAVPWMTVEPARILLEPGEDRSASLTISIPDVVASGGRYGAVAFTTVSPGADASTAVSGRILVPVLLTVAGRGELTREPSIHRAALVLESDGTLGARVEVRNDGNTHVPLTGDIEVAIPAPTPDPSAPTPDPSAPIPDTSAQTAATEVEGSLAIPTGRVLPASTRLYAGDGTLQLPLGETYAVTLRLALPPDQEALAVPPLRTTFSLQATPSLAIEGPGICLNADRGPSVAAMLNDAGSLGLVATTVFQIVDASGRPVAGAGASREVVVWPSEASDVRAEITDPLNEGDYTLIASATIGTGERVETRLPFGVGGDPATAAAPCPPPASPPPASPAPAG